MTDILLNKVINDEINVKIFLKWLLGKKSSDQNFNAVDNFNCTRIDFISYFLNFLHEEAFCGEKFGETPQKNNTPKRLEKAETVQYSPKVVKKRPGLFLNVSKEPKEHKTEVDRSLNSLVNLNEQININESSFYDNASQVSCSSSTPKPKKTTLETAGLNNSHMSPISPLYKTSNNFATPKNSRHSFNKSADKFSPLCLGDFIVQRKSSAKKKSFQKHFISEDDFDKVTTKRITPTSLSQRKVNTNFRKSNNSFNFQCNFEEVPAETFNQQRNLLFEERQRIVSRKNFGDSLINCSPKKLHNLIKPKVHYEPDLVAVKFIKQLDNTVEIYSSILNNNLILNITSEIYFLISLLLKKQHSFTDNSLEEANFGVDVLNDVDDKSNLLAAIKNNRSNIVFASDIFDTIHNVVYFASKSLETQIDTLKYYDKSTLKLLSDCKRLRQYSGNFARKLGEIADKKTERTMEIPYNELKMNVCFNADTDNRENFPNDLSFHGFRKQRDLFYEILRIWESNHLAEGWSFSISLSGKIRGLFSLYSDPANFMHFARLFKIQLLSTFEKTQKEEGLSEEQLSFLPSLPNVDADKLNRLKNRLVTKEVSNGIKSLPVFTGYQEFYKDFIVVASNNIFNRHLEDSLIAEIVELNDTKFTGNDLEDDECEVDPNTRKAYINCIKSSRILAKFLGFIESLPYKSECHNISSKNLLLAQLNLRQQTRPKFDVKKLLLASLKDHNLILVVPWLTEYLSMLDYFTLRLPYYIDLHKILFQIYTNLSNKLIKISSYDASMVKFSLGWLFELPHFPDEEYFNFWATKSFSLDNSEVVLHTEEKNGHLSLDISGIVNQNILYICCPYLEEIKKLLSANASGSCVTAKHITPLTATQSSNEIAKKKLEQQLEEAFFNGQPGSLRKTVEFVSERVASSCVKHICNNVVPNLKKETIEKLKKYHDTWRLEFMKLTTEKEIKRYRSVLRTKSNQIGIESIRQIRNLCESQINDVSSKKIPTSLDGLLALDVQPQTKDLCVSIATRMCHERVKQWLDTHVTINVFSKEYDVEVSRTLSGTSKPVAKKKPVFSLPPEGKAGVVHNEKTLSAAHMLEKVKELCLETMKNISLNEDEVVNILEDVRITLTERNDVNESISSCMCALVVDFSLLLVAHNPVIMTKEKILSKFVNIWRLYYTQPEVLFRNLVCPRNIAIMAHSSNPSKAWEVFSYFVSYLIKFQILSCDSFESQCRGIFKRDWDVNTLKLLTDFLHSFVSYHKNNGGNPSHFTFLLEFLSDFCVNL